MRDTSIILRWRGTESKNMSDPLAVPGVQVEAYAALGQYEAASKALEAAGERHPYFVRSPEGSSLRACVEFRGQDNSGKPTWYSGGCGTKGSTSVPWGNYIGTPAARAMSQSYFTGGFVRWWH